jgi:hypothetical protein
MPNSGLDKRILLNNDQVLLIRKGMEGAFVRTLNIDMPSLLALPVPALRQMPKECYRTNGRHIPRAHASTFDNERVAQ